VLAAKPVVASAQADAAGTSLIGTSHGLVFPDATPTQAVRRAKLACPAGGSCEISFPSGNESSAMASTIQEPGIAHVGGTIQEPRKIKNVPPAYPQAAREARIQGVVILECTIGTDGNVTNVTVSRGIPELDEAAVEAVRQWVYTPTILNGVAVPVVMTVTVNFRLE
jgi:TonB family protein